MPLVSSWGRGSVLEMGKYTEVRFCPCKTKSPGEQVQLMDGWTSKPNATSFMRILL